MLRGEARSHIHAYASFEWVVFSAFGSSKPFFKMLSFT